MNFFLISAILFFTTLSSSFSAKADGLYAGFLTGSTNIDSGVTAVNGATLDEDGSANSFFFGKKINENLSIEGFYSDLGEASLAGDNGDTFVVDGITYQFNTSATIAVSSTTLGLAAKYDFEINEKSNFFVKAGFHNWETELKVSVGTASASVTTDGSDTMYGLGAEYKLNEQFSLIAGYDNYTLDSEDVSFLNVGAKFQFK
jgi:OOP family OmpA-OmpF porin